MPHDIAGVLLLGTTVHRSACIELTAVTTASCKTCCMYPCTYPCTYSFISILQYLWLYYTVSMICIYFVCGPMRLFWFSCREHILISRQFQDKVCAIPVYYQAWSSWLICIAVPKLYKLQAISNWHGVCASRHLSTTWTVWNDVEVF